MILKWILNKKRQFKIKIMNNKNLLVNKIQISLLMICLIKLRKINRLKELLIVIKIIMHIFQNLVKQLKEILVILMR